MNYDEWEAAIDKLTHDAEHKESGAAFARSMGHDKAAHDLDKEAAKLRQACADLAIRPPTLTLKGRR